MQFERLSQERPCVVAKAAGLITVAILLSCCGQSAWGQLNANGNRIAGLRSSLPVIAPRDARPLEGADGSLQVAAPNASVGSFIDSISSSDAAFSVVIGQSRILTLKQGVADEDGNSVIAIGDPSVADFQQLPNPKLFRVLGLRPGVTDFSVTTAEDETISLEVHVTYDLKLLTGKLRIYDWGNYASIWLSKGRHAATLKSRESSKPLRPIWNRCKRKSISRAKLR